MINSPVGGSERTKNDTDHNSGGGSGGRRQLLADRLFSADIGTVKALTMESTSFVHAVCATVIVFVPAIHLSAEFALAGCDQEFAVGGSSTRRPAEKSGD